MWWMLSTAGKDGLATTTRPPGPVRDCRTQDGRLQVEGYELLQQPKTFKDDSGKTKTVTTWTWRLSPHRYREWEALLVAKAKAGDSRGLYGAFACLREMPMFAGVRAQVLRLLHETNRMLGKVGGTPILLPDLPVMRMQQLWDETLAL